MDRGYGSAEGRGRGWHPAVRHVLKHGASLGHVAAARHVGPAGDDSVLVRTVRRPVCRTLLYRYDEAVEGAVVDIGLALAGKAVGGGGKGGWDDAIGFLIFAGVAGGLVFWSARGEARKRRRYQVGGGGALVQFGNGMALWHAKVGSCKRRSRNQVGGGGAGTQCGGSLARLHVGGGAGNGGGANR